jgi:phosphatidylinositol-3-phosphatase
VKKIGCVFGNGRRSLLWLIAVLLLPVWASSANSAVPRLAHVVLVVFENHEASEIRGSPSAPTFNWLARRYVELTNYDAVAHPSLPNYLALVSGSTHNITTDCTSCRVAGPSLGTLLTRAARSWGGYAEGYPQSAEFAKKHMPFLYFAGQAGHVHPLIALRPTALPTFALVIPDLCHDMHDCSVQAGDRWLATFIRPLLRAPHTVIFVVFDEGTSNLGGGGHVAALAVGTTVRTGLDDPQPTNHYGLLRTIEDALGLRHLDLSARAKPLATIWRLTH